MENNFEEFENIRTAKRRDLLPTWIKVFCWIFMIAAVLSVIVALLYVINIQLSLDLFGFSAADGVVSLLIALSAFLFNGVAAFMLWTEHKDAVTVAKLSAYYGILLCIVSTILTLMSSRVMFRLEIILLVLFLNKLNKIEYDWHNA